MSTSSIPDRAAWTLWRRGTAHRLRHPGPVRYRAVDFPIRARPSALRATGTLAIPPDLRSWVIVPRAEDPAHPTPPATTGAPAQADAHQHAHPYPDLHVDRHPHPDIHPNHHANPHPAAGRLQRGRRRGRGGRLGAGDRDLRRRRRGSGRGAGRQLPGRSIWLQCQRRWGGGRGRSGLHGAADPRSRCDLRSLRRPVGGER